MLAFVTPSEPGNLGDGLLLSEVQPDPAILLCVQNSFQCSQPFLTQSLCLCLGIRLQKLGEKFILGRLNRSGHIQVIIQSHPISLKLRPSFSVWW